MSGDAMCQDVTLQLGPEQVLVLAADGPLLGRESDALELIAAAGAAGVLRVAVPRDRFDPAFFELANRTLGMFTQKLVNYGIRLAVLGDMAPLTERSKALADFVGESNRGRQIWFAADVEALGQRLAREAGPAS